MSFSGAINLVRSRVSALYLLKSTSVVNKAIENETCRNLRLPFFEQIRCANEGLHNNRILGQKPAVSVTYLVTQSLYPRRCIPNKETTGRAGRTQCNSRNVKCLYAYLLGFCTNRTRGPYISLTITPLPQNDFSMLRKKHSHC